MGGWLATLASTFPNLFYPSSLFPLFPISYFPFISSSPVSSLSRLLMFTSAPIIQLFRSRNLSISLHRTHRVFIIVTIHIVNISSTYQNHNYCLCHTNVHEQNMFIIINSLFAWAKANAPIETWYPRKKNKCTDIHFNSFFTVDFESLPLQQQTKNRIGRALF